MRTFHLIKSNFVSWGELRKDQQFQLEAIHLVKIERDYHPRKLFLLLNELVDLIL